ncbi:MAG: metallophosphoesterase [Bacteroidetes bacterium]|nr:metallophosphoesterase [Bacteroidota bacterium]
MYRQLLMLGIGCAMGSLHAQSSSFRFAFISDTHIAAPNGTPEEDLRRTVNDINRQTDLDFVLVTGDITEMGTDAEIRLAKSILELLRIPWYPIPGNHDTGWSESGGQSFIRLFGSDKFYFVHKGVHFVGCASGPYVRMSDGHIPRDAVNWLDNLLDSIPASEPLVFVNHYPIDSSLDNWYEAMDRLRTRNTLLALCGHGHANKQFEVEGIPAVMGRSNLRAKAPGGGYNWVEMRADSIFFTERKPLEGTTRLWASVKTGIRQTSTEFRRPDFSINQQYSQVKPQWVVQSTANILAAPLVVGKLVVVGNHIGDFAAYQLKTGKHLWTYHAAGAIYSAPAAAGDRLVFGSADGFVHCINSRTGKGVWRVEMPGPVLGCPLIRDNIIYIGGSAGEVYAMRLEDGSRVWTYRGLEGPVVSTPVIADEKLILGAWDCHLYALDLRSGELIWKWNNGTSVRNFSPASCTPLVRDSVVYIVAPDLYLSAIHVRDGKTLWRTREGGLRESIGLSADGQVIYGKSMQDTVVAYAARADQPMVLWKMPVGYGYDHVPSMLVEKDGSVYFGTRNGVIYAIDPKRQVIQWAHKIDHSMVNTVRVTSKKELFATTMDGRLVRLRIEGTAGFK